MEAIITYKEVKKLIVELGFHNSWSYWISNENKEHRMLLQQSKRKNKKHGLKTFLLQPTKHNRHFKIKYEFRIMPTVHSLDDVKDYIMEFYLNPEKDK